ncbi:MAG: tetraacyldisaccharide 4'-kinase [Proteobacteria bacterium]|nr:tetraacyldisaccharide 4'-kinase [Pseudomonadota bacterium]
MRAPAFWSTGGWPSVVLAPTGALTGWLTARRVAKPGWQAGVPVLCCGNAGVGGSGKTTLAIDLLQRLQSLGGRPHALLRGYGGRERGPLLVRPGLHDAARVGDEALLLAEVAPTWVSADRAAGAQAAMDEGADAIVMDDGLQNPGLIKDCSLLVIDGGFGFGNGRLLPAGPLREPVAAAADRCRAAILIGDDTRGALAQLPPGMPVLRAALVPDLTGLDPAEPYFAFAGIGRPEKFFAGLRAAGIDLAGTRAFADHHPYTDADCAALIRAAAKAGAILLTTPKDMARLAPARRRGIAVAGVTLAWADEDRLMALLAEVMA